MLALTRKKGESLVINNDIEITVLEIRGDQIKLGVSAPKEVPIYRKEVYTQIQQENKKSADAQNAQALQLQLHILVFLCVSAAGMVAVTIQNKCRIREGGIFNFHVAFRHVNAL